MGERLASLLDARTEFIAKSADYDATDDAKAQHLLRVQRKALK